ncbi:MAG TPA: hypothetical protein VJU61_10310 [Polyangiaceae bacterium]|nr:hypothetical protein [Polyangiaceae bacterium]
MKQLHVAAGVLVCLLTLTLTGAAPAEESPPLCRATGEACSLGIDPDIYQMPLNGEFVQHGERLICATRNWSGLPPEQFDLEFSRVFWFSLTDAERARIEGAAFQFTTTHWGPPAAAPADLSAVATPAQFAEEAFGSLASRTTRIEFEVPKTDFEKLGWQGQYLPLSLAPDPHPNVPWRLRGWYIRGDGVSGEAAAATRGHRRRTTLEHPLLLLSSGFPHSLASTEPVGGIAVGRQMRRAAAYFVALGYDVLMFDKRGHGYSEGTVDGMGEDIFRVLDQLEHGVVEEDGLTLHLSIITPEGRRLRGKAAARARLLGAEYTARTKPVVLRGFSYGAAQVEKAMAMNYSDLPMEYRFTRDPSGAVVVDESRQPAGNRGYAFKGVVSIAGFHGSLAYESQPFFLGLDAHASLGGHNGLVKSSVYESMDRWPAMLGLFATNDYETADGGIEAFNSRARGLKRIRMVTGYHFGLASEEVDSYFAEQTARFAREAIFGDIPSNNTATTRYEEEVCRAEVVAMDPATQSITGIPSGAVRAANRRVAEVLRQLESSIGPAR